MEELAILATAGRGHNDGWTGGGEQVQPGGSKPARGRAGGKKDTNTQIQIHKYKYANTNTQIQIRKYKYKKNTNKDSKPARGETGEKKYIKIIRNQLQKKQVRKNWIMLQMTTKSIMFQTVFYCLMLI